MRIILSPAKKMNVDTDTMAPVDTPVFLPDAERIMRWIKGLSYAEAKKLWKYMRDGETLPLTLGEHAYGRYRWSILSLSFSTLAFDRDGNLFAVQAAVSLQEYLRG